MAHDRILDLARNMESIASCSACGKPCFEVDYSKNGPESLKWSKPELLQNLRVGRGSHATIIRFCDRCLIDLGAKIHDAVATARVQP